MQTTRRTLLTISLAILASNASPFARAEDPLDPDQVGQILQKLDVIQDVLDGKRVSTHTSALQAFTAAAASGQEAYEFFLRCHKVLRFDSRDAKFTEYRDWRNRNEDKVKTKPNLAAMQLQLQYLVLTLRAAEGVDREVIVPEVERFVSSIVSNVNQLGGNGMKTLRSPVTRTIFAEAYELDKSLRLENWNFSPGDYGATFEKTIFPFLRKTAPDQLGAAWDRRIELEKHYTELTQGGNSIALEKFETERLPRLYWQKARDLYESVSQQQGAAAMLRIVQTCGEHPDVGKWVASFRELLIAPPPSPPVPEETYEKPPSLMDSFDPSP